MAKASLVIVGTGWAGYTLSQKLDEKKYDITVISPEETSPYTPLLVGSNGNNGKDDH
jgi:NADH:ubiquinone reductase (non-electrogenic)